MKSRDEMQAEFIANNGERPKRDRKQEQLTRKRNLGRTTSLKERSFKQKLLDQRWSGLKDGFLWMMNRYDPDGAHCEECGVPGDARTLDLNHKRRRGQGGEYEARNAELLCNRFNVHGDQNCHDKADGNTLGFRRSE